MKFKSLIVHLFLARLLNNICLIEGKKNSRLITAIFGEQYVGSTTTAGKLDPMMETTQGPQTTAALRKSSSIYSVLPPSEYEANNPTIDPGGEKPIRAIDVLEWYLNALTYIVCEFIVVGLFMYCSVRLYRMN